MNILKKINIYLVASIALFAIALFPVSAVYAACPDSSTPKGQVLQGVGATGSECDDDGVTSIIGSVVKILSYVVGIAAIIMIVWAGFRYITSGGDSNKVATAKNTLIYALVGIIVAALAQLLVNTVLTASSDAANSSSSQNQQTNKKSNSNKNP